MLQCNATMLYSSITSLYLVTRGKVLLHLGAAAPRRAVQPIEHPCSKPSYNTWSAVFSVSAMRAQKVCALSLLLSLLYTLQVAAACFSPADLFAAEVVLSKPGVNYDLAMLSGVVEVEYAGGRAYAYRSHYDEKLVVLLYEQELAGDRHLVVRLQVPVKEEVIAVHKCVFPASRCSAKLPVGKVVTVAEGSGEAVLELGELRFSNPAFVLFKLVLRVLEGRANFTVSGELTLESAFEGEPPRAGSRVYRVLMPCLVEQNMPCYRVMVVIPGYDAPLRVEEGVYRPTLKLSWISTGSASILVEELEVLCRGAVLPQPLPQGWTLEGGVLTGDIDSARVTVDLESGVCEVVVPGPAASLPREVEEQLRKLLAPGDPASLKLECSSSVDSKLKPAVEVGEEEVKAALKRELEWLAETGVVEGLSSSDIEAITAAARLGYAGWNSRLVWHSGAWVPYSEVPGAALLRCVTGVSEVFNAESGAYEQLRPAGAGGATGEVPGIAPAAAAPAVLVVAHLVALLAYLAVRLARRGTKTTPGSANT